MIQTINELSTYWDALENTMNIYMSEFSKEESEIDWSIVPTSTHIFVRNFIQESWVERCFAGCYKGEIYTFEDNISSDTCNSIMPWKYAKLKTTEG